MEMLDIVEARRKAEPTPSTVTSPYTSHSPIVPQTGSLDLLALAKTIYVSRRLFLAIFVSVTLLALLASFLMTPIFRAEVLLAPVVPDKNEKLSSLFGQLGGLGNLVEGYVGRSQDETAEAIAALRSRSLVLEFIRQKNLKPLLFPERWDAERGQWRDSTRVPSDLKAYEMFDQQIRQVYVDRRSGLVSLQVEWRDPTLAAQWANDLVRQVNERRRAQAMAEARRSIEHLQRQAQQTSAVEILEVIYRLIEAHTKTMTLANVREDYAFRIIDPAVVPERRVRPVRTVVTAIGAALGLALGCLAVVFRDARRRGTPRP